MGQMTQPTVSNEQHSVTHLCGLQTFLPPCNMATNLNRIKS